MAAGKTAAVSFDKIIQADRQKRKNEALANEILGKNRRASAPGSGVGSKKQTAASGSLASRIGVVKRSASATFKPKQNNLASASARSFASSRPASVNKRRPNGERLIAALQLENGQATVRDNGVGISIKGAGSGPFVVIGSNFAPGTTAADIQSALEPVGGDIVSCRVISTQPAVTAEMAFAEKQGAETVVANFDNQRADGRILSMRLKSAGAAQVQESKGFNPPTGPRAFSNSQSQSAYNGFREQADRARRESRRAEPQLQDGTHGFDERNTDLFGDERGGNTRYNNRRGNGFYGGRNGNRGGRDSRRQEQGPVLYSDEMMIDAPAHGSRNRGRGHR